MPHRRTYARKPMAYLTDKDEIYKIYTEAKSQSDTWREDYHEFERIANNELLDNLDPSLPEVNDGSLAAALYKLPKRIVNSNLTGRAVSSDRDEAWVTELANMVWEKKIIPNANSQAPFHRKWKDAVRKAAIYGSVPLVSLFVERGDYVGSDFIVAQPQDIKLEPGKVSDYDSNIIFWDVYYDKLQVESMIEQAKGSDIEANGGWDVKALKEILKKDEESRREPREDYKENQDQDTAQKGYKFCVIFQRGVDAPFYMYHADTKSVVREWTNPDPTGDIPVHFLYCYQDFVNPYGTGIVKLAGGTQNVLDYMRQSDVLATQLGFRPPVSISGPSDDVDIDSIVYEQDALWFLGDNPNTRVKREEISSQVYAQLPTRIGMYKTSLNQLLPVGDTSISAESGDPSYSKTPAGVKFQAANLSIDDEDFKDNLYMTYESVAESMINIYFANMEGSDLLKLSDDERKILIKAGLDWPTNENGEPEGNELDIVWETARSTFDFEIDAESDKSKDEEDRLQGLMQVLELSGADPTFLQELEMSGKKFNKGELLASIIHLLTDNDKIIENMNPEDVDQMALPQGAMQQMPQEVPQAMPQDMPVPEEMPQQPMQSPVQTPQQSSPEMIQQIMQTYNVDQSTATAMIAAEAQGFEPEEILAALGRQGA